MEVWQVIGGIVLSALAGGFLKEKFFSTPSGTADRLRKLEAKVAVLQETKLTEPQVRGIVHEQLQPLMVAVDSMRQEQGKQGTILARILERLDNQSKSG